MSELESFRNANTRARGIDAVHRRTSYLLQGKSDQSSVYWELTKSTRASHGKVKAEDH